MGLGIFYLNPVVEPKKYMDMMRQISVICTKKFLRI